MAFFSAMPAWGQALFATLFTYAMTAAGAALVFFSKKFDSKALALAEGLAAGIMIAASFFSLLLPAADRLETAQKGRAAFVLTAGFLAGGAFMMLSDIVLSRTERFRQGAERGGALMCAAMTLHNIPEGFAVGVAFGCVSGDSGALISAAMLALGIGVQNFPEGLCVALPLRKSGMGAGRAFLIGQASGLAEVPAGVLGALAVGFISALLPWALAFSAGAMIAVVCSELIPSGFSESKLLPSVGIVFGFSLMMFLDVFLG